MDKKYAFDERQICENAQGIWDLKKKRCSKKISYLFEFYKPDEKWINANSMKEAKEKLIYENPSILGSLLKIKVINVGEG